MGPCSILGQRITFSHSEDRAGSPCRAGSPGPLLGPCGAQALAFLPFLGPSLSQIQMMKDFAKPLGNAGEEGGAQSPNKGSPGGA